MKFSDSFEGPNADTGPRQDINSHDFYTRLGLSPDAPIEKVHIAFRKLSKKYHPDLGGDTEDFKKLSEARDGILSGKTHSAKDGRSSGSSGRRNSGTHSHRSEEPKKKTENFNWKIYDKARINRTEPIDKLRMVDRLSVEERAKKRGLNFLARESGIEAPYPQADEETITEYVTRVVAEAKAGTRYREDNSYQDSKSRGSYKSSTGQRGQTQERPRAENKKQGIYERVGPYSYTTNSIGSSYLIDPETGRELGSSYKKFEMVDRYLIATNSIGSSYLVDPQTGRELGSSYKKFEMVDRYLIATNSIGSSYLIDPETGRELGSSYKKITTIGALLVGENSIGSMYELDPQTGREVRRFMKR